VKFTTVRTIKVVVFDRHLALPIFSPTTRKEMIERSDQIEIGVL
jgi:hypothetical protein